MYRIEMIRSYGDEPVIIYDQNGTNSYPVVGPRCAQELNEAGNLNFTIYKGHPLFNNIVPLSTFVTAYDDGEEIFYGRVLQVSKPTLLGQCTAQCEGALSFLLDSEVSPDGRDANGNQITRTMTAEEFFRWCIEEHNQDIGNDPRRMFVIGQITATKKNESNTYAISSYTRTKDVIESQLLSVYGGFIRVRPNGSNGHYIDWIQQYERVNQSPIQIGENVEDQTNEFDCNELFTVIRPVGKKDNQDLYLPEGTINLYNEYDIQTCGRIVKTIEFNNADTVEKLRSEAEDYVNRMHKTMFVNSSIRYVDMHFIDGTSPKVRLGDRFTNIEGAAGEEMTASSIELDFEQVQNDSLTLKNPKSLEPDMTPEGNIHSSSASKSLTKSSRKTAAAAQKALKYYKELDDKAMITVKQLAIQVDDLDINVTGQFRETAQQFERISSRIDTVDGVASEAKRAVDGVEYRVQTIEGTDVIQNSSAIWNVSGQFDVWKDANGVVKGVLLKNGADLQISDSSGVTASVGERLGEVAVHDGLIKETIMGSALWTQKDNITGVCGVYEIAIDPETGQKTLVMKDGADLKITKDGVTQTVGTVLQTAVTDHGIVESISGSALWTQRDNITGVCGEYDVITDPETGKKTLVVKSGGGLKIRRNNVEYGLYDDGSLTAGIIAEKLNDGTTVTTINGEVIRIGESNALEVHITAQELAEFGLVDPNTGEFTGGIIVEKINDLIEQGQAGTLTKIKGDIIQLEGQTIAELLYSCDLEGQGITARRRLNSLGDLNLSENSSIQLGTFTQNQNTGTYSFTPKAGGAASQPASDLIVNAWVANESHFYLKHLDGDTTSFEVDGDTLKITDRSGNVFSFRKAASGPISSAWSGTTTNRLLKMSSGDHHYEVRFGGQDSGSQIYLANFAGTPTNFSSVSKLLTVPVTLKSGTYRAATQDVNYTNEQYTTNLYIDASSAYNAVTVDSIDLSDLLGPLNDTTARTDITIAAEASNGETANRELELEQTKWRNDSEYCVNLKFANSDDVIGRINIQNVYNAGVPSSGTASGRSGSTYDWIFAISKNGGGHVDLTIDCTPIYSDARVGYTMNSQLQATRTVPGSLSEQTIEPSAGYTAMKKVTIGAIDPTIYGYKSQETYNADVIASYNNGWGQARGDLDLPTTSNTSRSSFTIYAPSEIVDGDPKSYPYQLANNGNNSVDLQYFDGLYYIPVARLNHGKYNLGWDDAIGTPENHPNIEITGPDTLTPGEEVSYTVKATKSNGSVEYLYAKTLTVPSQSNGYELQGVQRTYYYYPNGVSGYTKSTKGTYYFQDGTYGENRVVKTYYKYTVTVDGTALTSVMYTESGPFSTVYREGYSDGLADASGTGSNSLYAQGWNAARAKTSGTYSVAINDEQRTYPFLPTATPANMSSVFGVRIPGETVDTSASYYYYLTSDDNEAYLRYGSQSGVKVARYVHNKYSTGYNDGWNAAAAVTRGTYDITIDGETRTYPYRPTTTPSNIGPVLGVAFPIETTDNIHTGISYRYYVTADQDYAYIRYGSQSGAQVARIYHGQYSSGWTTARSWTSGTYSVTVNGESRTYPYLPTSTPSNIGPVLGVRIPGATTGSGASYYYYLDDDGTYAYIRYGSQSGTKVAQLYHGATGSADGYLAGWNAARAKTSGTYDVSVDGTTRNYPFLPTATPANMSSVFGVRIPGETKDTASSYYYYLTSDNNEAYLRYGSSSGTKVAKYTHNKYNKGWEDSYDVIGLNYSSNQELTNGASITIYPTGKATPNANLASKISKGITVHSIGYWLYPTDDDVDQGTFAYDAKIKLSPGPNGAAIGVWQVPADRYQSGYTAGYTAGYSAGGSGGPGGTRYSAYCSYGSSSGGGNYTYTFTVTVPSGTFTAGKNYYIYNKAI